jgi:hypothetical protein
MSNGDCAIGAANTANVKNIMQQLKKYELKQDAVCGKVDGLWDDLNDLKLASRSWLIGIMTSMILLLVAILANIVIALGMNGR